MKRFKNNKDGTETDTKTGLMWCDKDAPNRMNWDEANEYASSLKTGGHTDWRSPDRFELESLLDLKESNPATKMLGIKPDFYWSSSPCASGAWCVDFGYGSVDYYSKDNHNHVRCVRGVQKGD